MRRGNNTVNLAELKRERDENHRLNGDNMTNGNKMSMTTTTTTSNRNPVPRRRVSFASTQDVLEFRREMPIVTPLSPSALRNSRRGGVRTSLATTSSVSIIQYQQQLQAVQQKIKNGQEPERQGTQDREQWQQSSQGDDKIMHDDDDKDDHEEGKDGSFLSDESFDLANLDNGADDNDQRMAQYENGKDGDNDDEDEDGDNDDEDEDGDNDDEDDGVQESNDESMMQNNFSFESQSSTGSDMDFTVTGGLIQVLQNGGHVHASNTEDFNNHSIISADELVIAQDSDDMTNMSSMMDMTRAGGRIMEHDDKTQVLRRGMPSPNSRRYMHDDDSGSGDDSILSQDEDDMDMTFTGGGIIEHYNRTIHYARPPLPPRQGQHNRTQQRYEAEDGTIISTDGNTTVMDMTRVGGQIIEHNDRTQVLRRHNVSVEETHSHENHDSSMMDMTSMSMEHTRVRGHIVEEHDHTTYFASKRQKREHPNYPDQGHEQEQEQEQKQSQKNPVADTPDELLAELDESTAHSLNLSLESVPDAAESPDRSSGDNGQHDSAGREAKDDDTARMRDGDAHSDQQKPARQSAIEKFRSRWQLTPARDLPVDNHDPLNSSNLIDADLTIHSMTQFSNPDISRDLSDFNMDFTHHSIRLFAMEDRANQYVTPRKRVSELQKLSESIISETQHSITMPSQDQGPDSGRREQDNTNAAETDDVANTTRINRLPLRRRTRALVSEFLQDEIEEEGQHQQQQQQENEEIQLASFPPTQSISTQAFFYRSGVRYLDIVYDRRTRTGHIPECKQPETEKDFAELSLVVAPELEQREQGYNELVQRSEQLKSNLDKIEEKLDSNNPPIFYHIQRLSAEDRAIFQKQLAGIKTHFKHDVMIRYYDWRIALERSIHDAISEKYKLLDEDIKTIETFEENIKGFIEGVKSEMESTSRALEELLMQGKQSPKKKKLMHRLKHELSPQAIERNRVARAAAAAACEKSSVSTGPSVIDQLDTQQMKQVLSILRQVSFHRVVEMSFEKIVLAYDMLDQRLTFHFDYSATCTSAIMQQIRRPKYIIPTTVMKIRDQLVRHTADSIVPQMKGMSLKMLPRLLSHLNFKLQRVHVLYKELEAMMLQKKPIGIELVEAHSMRDESDEGVLVEFRFVVRPSKAYICVTLPLDASYPYCPWTRDNVKLRIWCGDGLEHTVMDIVTQTPKTFGRLTKLCDDLLVFARS